MIITDELLLRAACEDVQPSEAVGLIAKLEQELHVSAQNGLPGIGLAAPQIGISKKAAIIRLTIGAVKFNVDLINAKIKESYKLKPFKNEGCLSFPGEYINTMRYEEIYVTNNLVEPHSFIATGILAVCIQHELDHLNGKLLIDWK